MYVISPHTLKQDLAKPWSYIGDRPGCGQSGSLTMLLPSLTLLNVIVVVVVGTQSLGCLTVVDWVGGVIVLAWLPGLTVWLHWTVRLDVALLQQLSFSFS